MSYTWDIFISYERDSTWSGLVRLIADEIRFHMQRERAGTVYFDVEPGSIPFGVDWPDALAKALSESRIMIPLISASYFTDENSWCRAELSSMLARQSALQERGESTATDIIWPVCFLDPSSDRIPPEISRLQCLDLTTFRDRHMREGTKKASKLSEVLQPFVAQLADACDLVPPHEENWTEANRHSFEALFDQKRRTQTDLPTLATEPVKSEV